jgi:hypothetical protein
MTLDFCRIEVTLIHDPIEEYDSATEVAPEDKVMALEVDNTQIDIELKLTNSEDNDSNAFTLTCWNLPTDVVMSSGDYIFLRWYWEGSPKHKSKKYVGVIEEANISMDSLDFKVELKGTLSEYFMFTNKKLLVSEYIETLADFGIILMNNTTLNTLTSQIPDFGIYDDIGGRILVYNKTLKTITEEIVDKLTQALDTKIRYQIQDKTNLVFYTKNDGAEVENVDVAIIEREDVFKRMFSSTRVAGELYYVYLETFGLPTLSVGSFIEHDNMFYKIEEIEHEITVSNGYNMKLYAYTFIPEDDATDVSPLAQAGV